MLDRSSQLSRFRRLVVKHDIEQRGVNRQFSIVVDKAQLAKLVHEEAHSGAGRSDHLRQRLLSDARDDRFRLALLAEIGQQQQHARQAFLARIEELIDEIGFDPDIAR